MYFKAPAKRGRPAKGSSTVSSISVSRSSGGRVSHLSFSTSNIHPTPRSAQRDQLEFSGVGEYAELERQLFSRSLGHDFSFSPFVC